MDLVAEKSMGRALERKAWGRIAQDGIFEIYLGVLLLNAVVWMAAAELGLAYGETSIPAFAVLLLSLGVYRGAKRRVTAPRMGHFKLERKRTSKVRLSAGLSVAVSVLMVAFTILALGGEFADGLPVPLILFGVLALKAVLLFSLGAYFTGLQRYYLYAILAAVGMAASEILVATQGVTRGWDVVGTLGLPAIVMLPTGIALLVRFVAEYPVKEVGDAA